MKRHVMAGARRQFVLVLCGAVVLSTAALASFGLAPQVRRLAAAEKNAPPPPAPATMTGQELAQRDAVLVALSQRLDGANVTGNLNRTEARVIDQLQQSIEQRLLDVTTLVPVRGERIDGFIEVRIDLAVTGDYAALAQWLDGLGATEDGLVVRELRINRAPVTPQPLDSADNPELNAQLTLASYLKETSK